MDKLEITELQLANDIVDSGRFSDLMDALSVNSHITKTDLRFNAITEDNFIRLANMLRKSEDCALKIIDLQYNDISIQAIIKLLEAIRTNSKLEHIYITRDCACLDLVPVAKDEAQYGEYPALRKAGFDARREKQEKIHPRNLEDSFSIMIADLAQLEREEDDVDSKQPWEEEAKVKEIKPTQMPPDATKESEKCFVM